MRPLTLSLVAVLAAASVVSAQRAAFDRLPPAVFDALPPSSRVAGTPGRMTIGQASCRSFPASQVRQRIVDLAIQEWGFFGFTVVDPDEDEFTFGDQEPRRFRRRLDPEESARVAASIAGYWTVTPGGDWILDNQNRIWNGTDGISSRWRYPWSAAFVSWVMCEGGLGNPEQFQRAIAHHVYIDQAIRARDTGSSRAAFAAYDVGEAVIAPGDLLCSGRRPAYGTLADRRRQIGEGARTHCDVVVKVDGDALRILAIGGNVRGSVSLKTVPAVREKGGVRPAKPSEGGGGRTAFAHLQLRAASIGPAAFDASPTLKALGCAGAAAAPARRAAFNVVPAGTLRCGA